MKLFDTTLRDGGNVVGDGFNAELTVSIVRGLLSAGIKDIELGSCKGLGAYERMGATRALSDTEYYSVLSPWVDKGRLGMFVLAGMAREDEIKAAADAGMYFLRVGANAGDGAGSLEAIRMVKKAGLYCRYALMKGYILSPAGLALTAAMGAGSFLTPKLLARLKRRTLLALSCTATAAAYPVFAAAAFAPGAAARTAVLMAGLLLIGTAIGIINVLFNALFMEQVDQSYMARVSGLANAALTSMLPVGSLLCAAAAAFCPVWATFLIAGAFLLLAFLPISRTKGFQGM